MWLFYENFSLIGGNNYGVNETNNVTDSICIYISADCAVQFSTANRMTTRRENNTDAKKLVLTSLAYAVMKTECKFKLQ